MKPRQHNYTVPIRTTPEELWKAVSTGEGLRRWFAPDVTVTPGPGGTIHVAWSPEASGDFAIEAWEPGKRLQTRFVEYTIETEEGQTVLRLVHSGFGEESSFDDEFESSRGAWPVFLNMLKHGLERHPGVPGDNITFSRPTKLAAAEAWQRIAATGETKDAVLDIEPNPAYHGFVLPDLNDAYLGVFCDGRNNTTVTVSLILYGPAREHADRMRAHWGGILDRIFPMPAAEPQTAAPAP